MSHLGALLFRASVIAALHEAGSGPSLPTPSVRFWCVTDDMERTPLVQERWQQGQRHHEALQPDRRHHGARQGEPEAGGLRSQQAVRSVQVGDDGEAAMAAGLWAADIRHGSKREHIKLSAK
jgi:hypothetical protein